MLSALTEECSDILYNYAVDKNAFLKAEISRKGGLYGRQKEVIEKYSEYANIPF